MKKRIKKVLGLVIAISLGGTSVANAEPSYYPTGPQTNVAESTISGGGWTLCYSEDLGTSLVKETISNVCTGTYILYAGKVTTSSSLLLLAAGERSTVFSPTNLNATNLHNGSYWYFNDSSLGFAPNGTITQNPADNTDTNDPLRFSLHTVNDGGWRIGTVNGVNNGGNNVVNDAPTIWTKQVWTSNGSRSSMPLVQAEPVEAKLANNIMTCSAGSYKVGMSEVDVTSVRYHLYVNDELMSSVVYDKGSNIPDALKSNLPNKVTALVSAKNSLFDLSGMSNYTAHCVVEAFGFGSSNSSFSNTYQDAAFIAAANAKAQAWEDQRATSTAANFTKEAREARKRAAARAVNG